MAVNGEVVTQMCQARRLMNLLLPAGKILYSPAVQALPQTSPYHFPARKLSLISRAIMGGPVKTDIPHRGLFIDGEWKEASQKGRLDVVNPSDGSVIGTIPSASETDVNDAVDAAISAFASWRQTTGTERAGYLRAIADKLKGRRAELARLETLDNGKPIQEAEADMDDVAATFEYYAGLAEKLDARQDQALDLGDDGYTTTIRREPLGAVGLICPWNFPLLMAAWKVAPALAAGNTAVLKPSELASITCLELAAIAQEVGLPKGVLNVITGLGADAGAPLSAHAKVAKVAFTGSVATGRVVNVAAAKNLRPATMELGGKSPMIIFEDADIDHAVEWAAFGIFANGGQVCSATSRLLLHKEIAPSFLSKLQQRAESIKISDPLQEDCRLGPLVSEGQYKKVLKYIEGAKQEGAKLLTGGGQPPNVPSSGFFVQPTVFTDVTPDMTIWREEVFGPVLATSTFADEAEAVRIANESEYGLGAAVVSKDKERCQRVSKALEAGIVWINCSQPTFIQAPWGGVKNSGFGRELGEWGLEAFMSVKQVTSYTSPDKWDWYPDATAPILLGKDQAAS